MALLMTHFLENYIPVVLIAMVSYFECYYAALSQVFRLLSGKSFRKLTGQTKVVSGINWGPERLLGLREKTMVC